VPAAVDLDAYFDRIRWKGEARPNLATLTALLRAHMAQIPFENLDVLLGRGIRIDLEALQQKLVRSRRGGYCFEHVTLFAAVLEKLGFRPVRHAARVILVSPRAESPRTHMFLTVPLEEGTFLCDPGFGGQAPRAPMPLLPVNDGGRELRVERERHWLVREGNDWILRADVGNGTVSCWTTTLEPENPVDFELANHFTATHPSSPFVNRMMLSALTPEGRVSAMNRDTTHWGAGPGGGPQRARLTDRAELRAWLAKHFQIDLPEVERLRVPTVPEWD
jgi:N-hydroxyarylamine O-acetyltransferase